MSRPGSIQQFSDRRGESAEIHQPYGRSFDGEAAWLRRLPFDALVTVTYWLAGHQGAYGPSLLTTFDRETLALLLERARYSSDGIGIRAQIDQGTGAADRQWVDLADVLVIRIEATW